MSTVMLLLMKALREDSSLLPPLLVAAAILDRPQLGDAAVHLPAIITWLSLEVEFWASHLLGRYTTI
jgi:hypothetical protein